MTAARKSFALSLSFHLLMGSLAFWSLAHRKAPPPMTPVPLKILSYSSPSQPPKRVDIPAPPVSATPVRNFPSPAVPVVPAPQNVATKPAAVPAAAPVATPLPTPVSAAPAPLIAPRQLPVAAAVASPEPAVDLSSEKKAFYAALRSTIQRSLRYPIAARRRGMEGEVDVRFTLFKDGRIDRITIERGADIFHSAAKAAVASAGGIDVPSTLESAFPAEIGLTLEFRLRGES